MELSEWVMTRPVAGSSSMARRPRAFPWEAPWSMRRAAVRCAMPIPSPMRTITLCAFSEPPVSGTISKFPIASTIRPLLCWEAVAWRSKR